MNERVVVLEGDSDLRRDLVVLLRSAGYDADEAASEGEALARAEARRADAVLVDVPEPRWLARVERVGEALPGAAVVAMGSNPSVELVIAAMQRGARDFLRKPFSLSALEAAMGAAAGVGTKQGDDAAPWRTAAPALQRVLEQAEAAAVTDATVLIVGESGSGKDRLARWIHQRSPRRNRPRVVLSCAAVPDALADSELFGHEAGAFTGAAEAREGQIRSAHGGTLVLDEIADASPLLQRKLLRALQEREVLPLGARRAVPVDARWIVTARRDLAEEVERGRLREDLYYRLDVIVLRLPSLRERQGDVPALAREFLEREARVASVAPARLDSEAEERLRAHRFRGNVRELENLMRRATVLYPGQPIDVERLLGGAAPPTASGENEWPIGTLNLREIERAAIVRSLAEEGGNRTRASRRLGISVRTLRNKLHVYDLA